MARQTMLDRLRLDVAFINYVFLTGIADSTTCDMRTCYERNLLQEITFTYLHCVFPRF